MGIRYSGVVRQVTADLATALEDLKNHREPRSVPLGAGEVQVRPVGAVCELSGGAFGVEVSRDGDRDQGGDGYRLMVSTRLPDPCERQRVRARQARTELEIGRRDGVGGAALTALGAQVSARNHELETCLHRAGLSTVDIRRELPVFRSRDLLRTGGGTEGDLRVFVRVPDPGDRAWLEEVHAARVPDLISDADLAAHARASVPEELFIDRVHAVAGGVRIDFHASTSGVSLPGNFLVRLWPSGSVDLRRFVETEPGGPDPHGWGEAETARRFADSLNGQVAGSLEPLLGWGATLTVIGVGLAPGGLRMASALGMVSTDHLQGPA